MREKMNNKSNSRSKNIKSKDAQMRETLIAIIIILFSFAIIILFITMLKPSTLAEKEACRQSVELRSAKIAKVGEIVGLELPLNCKTEEVKIKTTDEEKIKEQIAENMRQCWWMLGEGELVFFADIEKTAHCLICSIIEFDEKVQKKIPELRGLTQYLEETIIPNKNITYLEYFSSGRIKNIGHDPSEDVLKTSQRYAVLFMIGRGSSIKEYIIAAKGTATVLGIIGIISGIVTIGAGTIITGVTWAAIDAAAFIERLKDKDETYYISLSLIPYSPENLAMCTSMESIP